MEKQCLGLSELLQLLDYGLYGNAEQQHAPWITGRQAAVRPVSLTGVLGRAILIPGKISSSPVVRNLPFSTV